MLKCSLGKNYLLLVSFTVVILFLYFAYVSSRLDPTGEDPLNLHHGFHHSGLSDLVLEKPNLKQSVLSKQSTVNGTRITFDNVVVHFDLKGAAPTSEYLDQLFGVLKHNGVTGLLMEYEDQFPYNASLSRIKHGNGYTDYQFNQILESADANGLEVIPLIQTFGHLEYILKVEENIDIREVEKYPQVVCPSKNRTYLVLFELIDQYLKNHPKSRRIHIGADEAYYIARCPLCQKKMRDEFGGKLKRFALSHVNRVVQYIKDKRPEIEILIWYDLLVNVTEAVLQEFKLLADLQPVHWSYSPDLSQIIDVDNFAKFHKLFRKSWIGSAFKGANGSSQTFADASYYHENHKSWLSILAGAGVDRQHGIILTGWQRFDHFATLCELLPVAVPSLVLNLHYLRNPEKSFSGLTKYVEDSLRCNETTNFGFSWSDCEFPGSNVYQLIMFDLKNIRSRVENHKQNQNGKFGGWFSEYNSYHRWSHVFHAERELHKLNATRFELRRIGASIRTAMHSVYTVDTIDEWLEENILPDLNFVKDREAKLQAVINIKTWPVRPLSNRKLEF